MYGQDVLDSSPYTKVLLHIRALSTMGHPMILNASLQSCTIRRAPTYVRLLFVASFAGGVPFVAKKNSGKPTKRTRRTSLNSEGFFEPFNSEDVPWHRFRGSTAYKRLGH